MYLELTIQTMVAMLCGLNIRKTSKSLNLLVRQLDSNNVLKVGKMETSILPYTKSIENKG